VQIPARTASFVVVPIVESGAFRTQAVIQPYVSADINHLTLKLFRVVGGSEQAVLGAGGSPLQIDQSQANLGGAITFSNLDFDTSYRIRAYAYADAGTANLISTNDAGSYVDVAAGRDDRPTIANLRVRLVDRLFDGKATASAIALTAGTLIGGGSKTVGHIYPAIALRVGGGYATTESGTAGVPGFSNAGLTFENTGAGNLGCTFTAAGTWQWSPANTIGPNGNGATQASHYLPSVPAGALLLRRGSGTYELLGAGPAYKDIAAGEAARLVMNDEPTGFYDNAGFLPVTYACASRPARATTALRAGKLFYGWGAPLTTTHHRFRAGSQVPGTVNVTFTVYNSNGVQQSSTTQQITTPYGETTFAPTFAGRSVVKLTSDQPIIAVGTSLNNDYDADDDIAFGSGTDYPMFLPPGSSYAEIVSHAANNLVAVSNPANPSLNAFVTLQEGQAYRVPDAGGGSPYLRVQSTATTSAIFGNMQRHGSEQAFSEDMKTYYSTQPSASTFAADQQVDLVGYFDGTVVTLRNFTTGTTQDYPINAGQRTVLALGNASSVRLKASGTRVFGYYLRQNILGSGSQHMSADNPGRLGTNYWVDSMDNNRGTEVTLRVVSLTNGNTIGTTSAGSLTNIENAPNPGSFTLSANQMASIALSIGTGLVRVTSTAPVAVFTCFNTGEEDQYSLVPAD
jgi:hypothetical protein